MLARTGTEKHPKSLHRAAFMSKYWRRNKWHGIGSIILQKIGSKRLGIILSGIVS
jgi:hypothetical protein